MNNLGNAGSILFIDWLFLMPTVLEYSDFILCVLFSCVF